MTTHHVPSLDLLLNLGLVLAVFAAFAWCIRRGMLKANEVAWLGAAIGFFATSLIFNAVLRADRPTYGVGDVRRLLGVTALMTLPLALALGYGVVALYRSLLQKTLASVQIDGLTLRLVLGNIAALGAETPLDAVVSPADTDLRMRPGVAGALAAWGGAGIGREARAQAPVAVGQAVATGAGRLDARHVIHAAMMGRDRKTNPDKIEKAVEGALKCARKIGARRLAFPAFEAGLRNTAASAPLVIQAIVRARKGFDEVVIVVPSRRIALAFQAEFKTLAEAHPAQDSASVLP